MPEQRRPGLRGDVRDAIYQGMVPRSRQGICAAKTSPRTLHLFRESPDGKNQCDRKRRQSGLRQDIEQVGAEDQVNHRAREQQRRCNEARYLASSQKRIRWFFHDTSPRPFPDHTPETPDRSPRFHL